MPHDPVAVDELVTGHLALVGHLVREAAARLPRHLDTDDLFGAGALALVQAAQSFDPTLGVPFARFASTRIRGAMIDQMRQRDWATRSVRSRARAIAAVTEELTKALHRAPTDAELAAASGMSEQEVRQVLQGTDRAALLSLDPLGPDDEGLAAGLVDGSPRPEDALVAAERIGYLRDAIAELPARARLVITGYYLENRQLTELAEELGVTQSRASQLRSEGLDLLHAALARLLGEGTPTAAAPAEPDGVRSRRREAYVQAVSRRSSVRDRTDVQAYLDGSMLHPAGPGRPASTGTSTGSGSPIPAMRSGAATHAGSTAPATQVAQTAQAAQVVQAAQAVQTVQTVQAIQAAQTAQAAATRGSTRGGGAVAAAAAAYSGRTRAG